MKSEAESGQPAEVDGPITQLRRITVPRRTDFESRNIRDAAESAPFTPDWVADPSKLPKRPPGRR